MEDKIELEITCKDMQGHLYGPKQYILKLSQIMSNYTTPPETYEGQIAYYLKDISKNLANR